MFPRFSDSARRALTLADEAARGLNHEYIGTEHILLGLIQDDTSVVVGSLKALGVDSSQIRLKIEQLVQRGPQPVSQRKLPFTPRAKRAIECAEEEAWNLQQDRIGPEHLVLGLLREHEGVAGQVLLSLGLNLDVVRERVLELRMSQLKFVERVVRPVRAGTPRKRKMREELLAHLTAVYDEEFARLHDPVAAMRAAVERFGEPSGLTRELESSLPFRERIGYFSERWFGWRAPETATRWMLRAAAQTCGLLLLTGVVAAAIGIISFGWNVETWLAMRPMLAFSLLLPIEQFAFGVLYFKLRDTWYGVFGSRKSLFMILVYDTLIVSIHVAIGTVFTIYAGWKLVPVRELFVGYGLVGLMIAVCILLIARAHGAIEIRDTLWACLDVHDATLLGNSPVD